MGTSVDVYPCTTTIPTFGEVQAKAADLLREFSVVHDLTPMPAIEAHWRRGNAFSSVAPDALFSWEDIWGYAWFTLSGIPGGTDVIYRQDPSAIPEYLEQELLTNPRFKAREADVRACMQVGRRWTFCRWGGAAAMTNVAYGILAASVAMLTDGILDSYDSAWDYQRFPATPAEFTSWWYVPEKALSETHRNWARKCIAAIRAGVQNPNEIEL